MAKEYEAQFNSDSLKGLRGETKEVLQHIAKDMATLMYNSNLSYNNFENFDKRIKTIDNIIGKMVGERIELEKRIEGLENHLFRDRS
jgi:uncharacterized membrane protein YqgA involved in biofilm formation|tara:strand:- start:131 stop:391 length:261 start_codon:yes stop_codon:yes gene_type:complete